VEYSDERARGEAMLRESCVVLAAVLSVWPPDTGLDAMLDKNDSVTMDGRENERRLEALSLCPLLFRRDSTEEMRVSATPSGTETEGVYSESWYVDDVTEADAGCWLEIIDSFDCISDDSILLEMAVGKTLGTSVPKIEVILSAILVEADTSEGFPKDLVSTIILEDMVEIVLLAASKDCVLLADPKGVDCFDSMELPGKEGEDTLGGTVPDDVSNTRDVTVNPDETELGEPKKKDDAREKIPVDFGIETVSVKPDSGPREGATTLDDWTRVEKLDCLNLELNDLEIEGICARSVGNETVACPAKEDNPDEPKMGDSFKDSVPKGKTEDWTPSGARVVWEAASSTAEVG
jgi:hypothetical protein